MKASKVLSAIPATMAGRLRTACATKLLPLLLVLMLPAAVQAQFTYTTNNGTITITGYTGAGGAVTIPSTINGLPVTCIRDGAFSFCPSLTSITIPNSVTNIGSFAFSNCTSLTNITIGNSVTSIGEGAFWNCTNLTSVTIPNSVTTIGRDAFNSCWSLTNVTIGNSVTSIEGGMFDSCTSLESVMIGNGVTNIGSFAFYSTRLTTITVDATNPAYSSMDGVLFNKSQSTLIKCPGGKAGSHYTIPNSVTSIGGWAFSCCTRLTSVTIGNGVTSIGNDAFNYCTNLTSITIPNSVTSIGDYAFSSCTSLTGVYFRGNAPSIGLYVFVNDTNTTVYYVLGTTGWGTTFGGRPTALWYPPVLTATHSSCGYLSPGTNTVSCQVSYLPERQLYSLLWRPALPLGWALLSATGDGSPEVGFGEIVFTGLLTNNPLNFSFSVSVPAGVTAINEIRGNVRYQLNGMANPETNCFALPDPLRIGLAQASAISRHPTNQTVCPGANAAFTIEASGTEPLNYQWQFNGNNLVGGGRFTGTTSSHLIIANVLSSDAGSYGVVVGNACGMVTNSSASLTVNAPPSISIPPTNQTVCAGGSAVFCVAATGTPTLSYQWQFNGDNLTNNAQVSGVTTVCLSIANVQATDVGNYSVAVYNACGAVTSEPVVLAVTVAPTIVMPPASQTVRAGANVTLAIAATGTMPLSYQWQFNGIDLANGGRISGATSPQLTIAMAQAGDMGSYSAVVSNSCGWVTATAANLLVYHSADYQEAPWVIDSEEVSRVLAFWRAQSYHLDALGWDGYAPGPGNTDGAKHSADYRAAFWQVDGSEVSRVFSYWRAGGYHADPIGLDGYAPSVGGGGALRMSAPLAKSVGGQTIRQQTASIYTPGTTLWVTNRFEYTGVLLSLLWRPQLPTGWTLLSVSGDGDPKMVGGEIVWTGIIPESTLSMVYGVEVPAEEQTVGQIRGESEYVLAGMVNPAIQYAGPDPLTVATLKFLPPEVRAGEFQWRLLGESGRRYQIQVSMDFQTWTDVGLLTAIDGTAQFSAPMTGDGCFYRAILQP